MPAVKHNKINTEVTDVQIWRLPCVNKTSTFTVVTDPVVFTDSPTFVIFVSTPAKQNKFKFSLFFILVVWLFGNTKVLSQVTDHKFWPWRLTFYRPAESPGLIHLSAEHTTLLYTQENLDYFQGSNEPEPSRTTSVRMKRFEIFGFFCLYLFLIKRPFQYISGSVLVLRCFVL